MDRNPGSGHGVPQGLDPEELRLALFSVARRFKAVYKRAAGDGLSKDDLRLAHGALWGRTIEEKDDPPPARRVEVVRLLLPHLPVADVLTHLSEYRSARAEWERLQRERKRQ